MIDRIIEFSVRNRAAVITAGLVLALAGVFAARHTPVDAIPDLSENQVIVFTDWMGHSPREIEDQITYPLSVNMQGLAGVKVVRSSSDFNFSMISVIFEDSVDFYAARRQVEQRLSRLADSLPPGVSPRLTPDAVATGQIYWYTVEGAGYDLGRLRTVQDSLIRTQLSSVPGVAEVASVGGYAVEYQIEVDPERLRALGVTLADVVDAVSQANSSIGGHVVHKGNAEYVVRSVGWLGTSDDVGDGEPSSRRVVEDLEAVVIHGTELKGSPYSNHFSAGASTGPGVPRWQPERPVRVSDVATVTIGPGPRRGVLEKDGSEMVGGVVLMRYGENPLEVTQRIQQKIGELRVALPSGVRIVPCYDRTPLIRGAIRTVTGTLAEAILTATVCVVIVLLHFRTSFIIAVTLPLATLTSFVIMWILRRLGIADIQTNIMSLAGIAISIGVLVDSSIVMAENVMHNLKERFGDRPVRGDIRDLVLPACRTVGRPIFFSVLIMLVSFMPVFALGGMEGKMFRPLAFTKSFALLAVAVLAITLVPALCTVFVKGRLRRETQSWVVRSFIEVYRPVLSFLLDRPATMAWIMGVTLIVGLAPIGNQALWLAVLFGAIVCCGLVPVHKPGAGAGPRGFRSVSARRSDASGIARTWPTRVGLMASLVLIALVVDQNMQPLDREFMTPLDEGTLMDMPITVPRASITQAGDDLKARDMMLCRFPEVEMVMGKAGRAETPTDPAPVDMIETMVSFRPSELWPKRALRVADAERQCRSVLRSLIERRLVADPEDAATETSLVNEAVTAALPVFDAQMRDFAYLRNQEFTAELGRQLVQFAAERTVAMIDSGVGLARQPGAPDYALLTNNVRRDVTQNLGVSPTIEDVTWIARHVADRLVQHGVVETGSGRELLRHVPGPFARVMSSLNKPLRAGSLSFLTTLHQSVQSRHRALWRKHVHQLNGEIHGRAAPTFTRLVTNELLARFTVVDTKLVAHLAEQKRLQSQSASPTAARTTHHGGRPTQRPPTPDPHPVLDSVVHQLTDRFSRRLVLWPRERTELAGFGGELDRVLQMPGWTNVWTMPIQNRVDMLATGVNTAIGIRVLGAQLDDVVRASEEIAAVVKQVPGAVDVIADPIRGKGYLEFRPDRDKLAQYGLSVGEVNDFVEIATAGKIVTATVEGRERHPVRVRLARAWREDEESLVRLPIGPAGPALGQVAAVRVTEGPATIKSENGLLRNYVRLNARGRGVVDVVEDAKRVVAEQVKLPEGVFVEWTGQFEHQVRARRSLMLIVPIVVAVIFAILYFTYHDFADALLMMLAVPGAIAGGVFFQWLLGYRFSVTVWVGYIACFGMATATGIIMLVYLREAVAKAGGLNQISLDGLRQAVIDGAVHRLRPKLLTEGTTILGLAPMLWATGPGSEVIKPMAAPVLGGILVADEVIDLFLPVLFYWVRRRRWEKLHSRQHSAFDEQYPSNATPTSQGAIELSTHSGLGDYERATGSRHLSVLSSFERKFTDEKAEPQEIT